MGNVYTILTGNFGDLVVDRRMVLILNERGARVWTGFIQLRIGSSAEFL
jgi:hypothetical protein